MNRNTTNTSLVLFGMVGVILAIFMGLGDARHIVGRTQQVESIPSFLLRMYEEMGRDKLKASWKAFNNRNSEQQDAFLMEGLSNEELQQLGSDFENLAMELSADPKLMELYADFERNLSIVSFMEMDKRLEQHHTWWGRIKKFLYRKLEKLVQDTL